MQQSTDLPERKRLAQLAFYTRLKNQLRIESTRAADSLERQAALEELIRIEDKISTLEVIDALSVKEGIPA